MQNCCLADFDIQRLLGRGGFGEAWLAKRKNGGDENVVIKKVSLERLAALARGDSKQLKKMEDMTWNEGQLMLQLKNDRVVNTHLAFRDDGVIAIVMEYCEGGSLKEALCQRTRPFEDQDVCWIMAQITMGLAWLHERNILHRDIKSENILLSRSVSREETIVAKTGIKLADFGLAKVLETSEDATASTICGTPNHMAPEILRRERYSFKSDLWSFGIVSYELASSRLPFPSKDVMAIMVAISSGKIPPIENPSISEELRNLISTRMLVAEVAKRCTLKEVANFSGIRGYFGDNIPQPILVTASAPKRFLERENRYSEMVKLTESKIKKKMTSITEENASVAALEQELFKAAYSGSVDDFKALLDLVEGNVTEFLVNAQLKFDRHLMQIDWEPYMNCLHLACRGGDHLGILQTIVSLWNNSSLLRSDNTVIESDQLVRLINYQDEDYGWTVLHWATRRNRIECVKFLCGLKLLPENGCNLVPVVDVELRCNTIRLGRGCTAYMIASYHGHVDCLKILLKCLPEDQRLALLIMRAVNAEKQTALQLARSSTAETMNEDARKTICELLRPYDQWQF